METDWGRNFWDIHEKRLRRKNCIMTLRQFPLKENESHKVYGSKHTSRPKRPSETHSRNCFPRYYYGKLVDDLRS